MGFPMDPGIANKSSAFCPILITTLKGTEMLAAPGGMLIFGGDVSAFGLASFVVTVPMLATSLKPQSPPEEFGHHFLPEMMLKGPLQQYVLDAPGGVVVFLETCQTKSLPRFLGICTVRASDTLLF